MSWPTGFDQGPDDWPPTLEAEMKEKQEQQPTPAPAWIEMELNRDVWRAYAVDLSALLREAEEYIGELPKQWGNEPLRERINAALSLARKHYGGTSG